MKSFLLHWMTVAIGVWVAASVVSGVAVDSIGSLGLAGLVLGFVNAAIRPVLAVLTFPITLLTLGLFYLVVNGLAFGLAAFFVPGFHVDGLFSAIGGAIVASAMSWFVGLFAGEDDEKDE